MTGTPTGHDLTPIRGDECRCPACRNWSFHPMQQINEPKQVVEGWLVGQSYCTANGPNWCAGKPSDERCSDCPANRVVSLTLDHPTFQKPVVLAVTDNRPSHCPQRIRDEGVAPVPRSCRTCGIRKCQFETLPKVEAPPLVPVTPPARRTVVAFTGLAGSGKSTAAAHLVDAHGFTRLRFAGPLKDMMRALGLTEAEIEGDHKEQPCALLGGRTPRYAMQTIGSEWGRNLIAPDLWIRAWRAAVDKLPPGTPVVVDDCRFPNEAEIVRALGGLPVRIVRPGAGTASTHSSEGQDLRESVHILNAGTLADLFMDLDHLLTSQVRVGEFRA